MATSRIVSVYKAEDLNLFRLKKIMSVEARKVMHVVYKEGTRARRTDETLFDFYRRRGIPDKKFKKNLNSKQIQNILDDPVGECFDITLLCQCILWGENGVVHRNDDNKWREGSTCLESLLTSIKNMRNALFHQEASLNAAQFFKETEKLRDLLADTLWAAKKIYRIPSTDVVDIIKDMNTNMNKFRDESLIPKDLATYKKESLFWEKCRYVETKGKLQLVRLYRRFVYITPAFLICKLDFKVTEIYTQMVLEGQSSNGESKPVLFKELLDQIQLSRSDPFILIEGLAGVGKTTLTKKIMDDWVSGHSAISKLVGYDLLLHVECRNNTIQSFKDLVRSLMPKVASLLSDNDYDTVILKHKILVIIDGLDELNRTSVELFKEIIEIKKTHGITVIITTRPERVNTYYQLTTSHGIKTIHIKVEGIPKDKRKDYVIKYFTAMENAGKTRQDVNDLLLYLERTANRLSQLWKLPYNLTLLTMLWFYKANIFNTIATAPQLYWEIHQLLIRKLYKRLLNCQETQHLKENMVKNKIHNFIYTLSYEAFVALANDDINLSYDSFKRLEDACISEGLPSEEMTGAFLKGAIIVTPLGINTKQSFPHKVVQEFLAALYVSSAIGSIRKENIIENIFSDFANSQKVSAASGYTQQISQVKSLLERVHGTTELDLRKYQNMMITLLGLFHLNEIKAEETMKQEVLHLLTESGIRTRDDWLRILDSVRCDHQTAKFVSQQHNIFSGTLSINDSNVFAFISILGALTDPIKEAHNVNVFIYIKDPSGINEILGLVNEKKLNVKRLRFEPNFRRPATPVMCRDALKQVLQRCSLERYKGAFVEGMSIPTSLWQHNFGSWSEYPSFSVANIRDYDSLCHELNKEKEKQQMRCLNLCVSSEIAASELKEPIPVEGGIDLYLPDASDIAETSKKVKALMPVTGDRKIWMLFFPRCGIKSSSGEMERLLQNLFHLEVKLRTAVVFPSPEEPEDSAEEEKLQNLAQQLGAYEGIQWMDEEEIWPR